LVPGTGLELEALSGRERVSFRDERESAAEILSGAKDLCLTNVGKDFWCREQDLNLHAFRALDPKSSASANSAIPAWSNSKLLDKALT
jgi:hypothetical protein